jgi:hypothetical protein
MIRTPALMTLIFALTPAASAYAGWTAKQVSKSVGGDAKQVSQKSELLFDRDLFRIDQEDNTSVIMDLSTGKMTMLNHKSKQHASLTLEQMVAMRDQQLAMMKAQLPQMPPEIRKQAEAKLKEIEESAKLAIAPKSTGKKDKVGAYDCTLYTWTAPDGENEACVATSVGVDVSGFAKATAKLAEKLSAVGAGSPSFAMLQLGKHGFPVRTKRTIKNGGQSIDAISEVSEIKEAKLDAAKFQVPPGYKETDFMTLAGASTGSAPPH